MKDDNEYPLRILYGEVFISGNLVLTEREGEPLKRPKLIDRLKNFLNKRDDHLEWNLVEPSDGERMKDINWKMIHQHHPENYAIIRMVSVTEPEPLKRVSPQ